ncbi:discoidin domain-containing protein [Paenibacillus sp. NPDC057934]|uniref:discoidin domain-containing protein n=1 Tax=Paenibacillus sp. NPDC057934 TaxID=3346282 RepID=UPI0036DFA1BF
MGDDNLSTVWSSGIHYSLNAVEWAAIDFGDNHLISEITLTPRQTLSFPKDFKIQYRNDTMT